MWECGTRDGPEDGDGWFRLGVWRGLGVWKGGLKLLVGRMVLVRMNGEVRLAVLTGDTKPS